jgi:hypothetical protein
MSAQKKSGMPSKGKPAQPAMTPNPVPSSHAKLTELSLPAARRK